MQAVDGVTVKEHQRHIVLLRVCIGLGIGLDAAENFVKAVDGRFLDIPHGTAAVHDDYVVNFGFAADVFHGFLGFNG